MNIIKWLDYSLIDGTYKPEIQGTSAETKPTTNIMAGATFYETDTGANFTYSGTAWVKNDNEDITDFAESITDIEEEISDIIDEVGDLQASAIVAVTGNKILALTDALTIQKVTATSAITIPPNDDVAFIIGTRIDIISYITTDCSFVAGSGVTIRSKDTKLKIDGQYAGATLIKIAENEWALIGALKA